MIKSTVVLVEEHDEVPHGKILVQKIAEADQPEIEDAFGNWHKIERYIVMTEHTMDELLAVLKDPDVQHSLESCLPSDMAMLTVVTV